MISGMDHYLLKFCYVISMFSEFAEGRINPTKQTYRAENV